MRSVKPKQRSPCPTVAARLLVAGLLFANHHAGAVCQWTVAGTADWNSDSRWSPAKPAASPSTYGAGIGRGGTVQISGGATWAYLKIGFDGGTTYNGSGTLEINPAANLTINGAITIGAGVQNGTLKVQGGTLRATTHGISNGSNSGITNILLSSGILDLNGKNIAGNLDGFSFIGGTLRNLGNATVTEISGTGDVTGLAGILTINAAGSFGGTIDGPGSLHKTGAGTLILTGTNTYAGATTVAAGTLRLGGGANRIPSGTPVIVNGTLDLDDQSQTVGSLLGSGIVNTAGGALAIEGFASSTYNGVITGTGSFTKSGTGTLTLAGPSSYSGETFIQAGTLALAAGGSIGSTSRLSLAAGATLDLANVGASGLGAHTGLHASGTGTTPGATAAAITGATEIAFGTRPITLNYNGSEPALLIAEGILSLEGNSFTVNRDPPLTPGTYPIIRQADGTIASSGSQTVSGTAIGAGYGSAISIAGGEVLLSISVVPGTTVGVETAANGSGSLVAPRQIEAGASVTLYAIARTADGQFLGNVSAAWSLATSSDEVSPEDLVVSSDGKSATFTGNLIGSATVGIAWENVTSTPPVPPLVENLRATGPSTYALTGQGIPGLDYPVFASSDLVSWSLLATTRADAAGGIRFEDSSSDPARFYRLASTATDSGTLTVVPGPPVRIGVETLADGTGTIQPSLTLAAGHGLEVHAILRDANGNFAGNPAADSWTIADATGGVSNSDLDPASGSKTTFNGTLPGTGKIRASYGGLPAVDSGKLTVLVADTLVWSANPANYRWEEATPNWTGESNEFTSGAPVLFTDDGSAASPIILVGSLSPASVTVDTSSNHYTFGGTGFLTGVGGLTKSGTGTFTLANSSPNTYTGATLVKAGTLEVATAAAFNTPASSPITISAGATLFFNVGGINTWSNQVSGEGWWKVATGSGSQTAILAGNYSGFSGTLEVMAGSGKIQLSTATSFPAPSATLRLNANTTAFFPNSGIFPCAIEMSGGTTGEALGQLRIRNGIVLSGPVTFLADTTIGVDNGHTATISGGIGGNYGFTKVSPGTLSLSGNCAYTGPTTIGGGSLLVNGTLGHPDSVVTAAGGTLGGRGEILSRVEILSNGTLSPGAGGIGTLTVSNQVTLSGQTVMELNKSASTSDLLTATGKITFGGTLILNNLSGTLTMGDCFTLFDGASYGGSFSSISPATPGSGLVWDTSSLAVDGTLMVMGSNVITETLSYAGYNIKVRSRFHAYNSLVNRAYPLYDYSVNVMKVGSSYRAVTGNRYTGSGEDGDHIFGWSSPAGQPSTWTNIKGSGLPLFLKKDTFAPNVMDPEVILNPANNTWYMFVQKQLSSGDRIMALTSTNLKDWTAFKSRSVITNIPADTHYFHHHEVIHVPWSSKPFWLYVSVRVDGQEKGYKLIKSDDPLTFDYNDQVDSGGERNLGGQRGYLQEAPDSRLFVRITSGTSGSKSVPILQFSQNGTGWTYNDRLVLMGSSNTGRNSNCYFPGIATINGNGALEYLGNKRWKAIYAATTSASPTAPDIFYSEIGCGELVIELE